MQQHEPSAAAFAKFLTSPAVRHALAKMGFVIRPLAEALPSQSLIHYHIGITNSWRRPLRRTVSWTES